MKSTCKAHARGQNAKQVCAPTGTRFHALDMRYRESESWGKREKALPTFEAEHAGVKAACAAGNMKFCAKYLSDSEDVKY